MKKKKCFGLGLRLMLFLLAGLLTIFSGQSKDGTDGAESFAAPKNGKEIGAQTLSAKKDVLLVAKVALPTKVNLPEQKSFAAAAQKLMTTAGAGRTPAEISCDIKREAASVSQPAVEEKKVKYAEISTACVLQSVLDELMKDEIRLMEAPAGSRKNGKVKILAGKKAMLITEEDLEVLHRIVEAEATYEDVEGRMLVANVILNRVKSKGFPNTVTEVVFQNNGEVYQFAPIKDKRYWKVNISDKTKEAVQRVIAGEDLSQGAMFFAARKLANPDAMSWFDTDLKFLFRHGVHEFFCYK